MDFNALQHKLFAMDPVDPREDLARLKAQAGGNAPAVASENIDYLKESAVVTEGSLKMDRDYSVNDFAALAGVVNEKKQRSADQVRGEEPMPTAKPGRKEHPFQDRLVGEEGSSAVGYASDPIEARLTNIERMLQQILTRLGQSESIGERELSKKEIRQRDRYADDLPDSDFKDRYGDDWEAVKYGTATNMAKRKSRNESVDSIKDQLFAALNKKLSE